MGGSIGIKSEELETTNLHSTHVLFSGDIASMKIVLVALGFGSIRNFRKGDSVLKSLYWGYS